MSSQNQSPHGRLKRKNQQTGHRTATLQAILQLNAGLATMQDENELLNEALSGLCQVLDMRHVTCYERLMPGDLWAVRMATWAKLKPGDSVPSETAVLLDQALAQSTLVQQKQKDGLLVAIPLTAGKRTLGALVADSGPLKNRLYDPQDFPALLQTVAQNLAALWNNLLLLQEAQRQNRELTIFQNSHIDTLWNATQIAFQAEYTEKGFHFQRLDAAKSEKENGQVLPLSLGDIPFGSVSLSSANSLNPEQMDLIQSLTREMGNALNNAFLLQTTRIHANQLALATEVSRAATTILDRNLLIQEVVDLIQTRFNLYYVGLFLVDPHENKAVLQAGTGEAGRLQVERKHTLIIGGPSMIGTAVARGKAIVEQDVRQAAAFTFNPLLPDTRAELALPLRTRGRVIGALTVQSSERHAFSEESVAVLQNLADQLAIAIETATLFEQTQGTLAETSRLYKAGQKISAAQNSLDVYKALIDFARHSDTIDAAQILINDPEDSQFILSPQIWSRIPLTDQAPAKYLRGQYWFSQTLPDKQITFQDVMTDPRLDEATRDWFASNHLRACTLITLRNEGEWLGTVALHSQRAGAFHESSLQSFLTLTDQAAIILANQRLLGAVQAANEQLRQLDQLKTQFLANMSHELRTPLNSIIGFSRVILKGIDGPINADQEEDLTSIYNNGQHLLRLINEILDMAKIEAGKLVLAFDQVDLTAALHASLDTFRSLAQEKGLELYVHIEPDLPSIEADAVRLQQILNNLLSNAVKYTDVGAVSLSAKQEGANHVRITVQDSGIGISQKDFDKLFAAFEQVDSSTTRAAGGTGLGLPITKWLVNMHQGTIAVESQVNRGSTFHVVLPRHQDESISSQMTFAQSLKDQ